MYYFPTLFLKYVLGKYLFKFFIRLFLQDPNCLWNYRYWINTLCSRNARKLPGVFEQSPVAILLDIFTHKNIFFFQITLWFILFPLFHKYMENWSHWIEYFCCSLKIIRLLENSRELSRSLFRNMDLSLDSGRMKNYNVVVTIYGYCEVIQSNNSA